MSNIFFTADTHFNHTNIMKYCGRPFKTVEDMNETIISRWNEIVTRGDLVYHLGDFSWSNGEYFKNRLLGNIILIKGNHDKDALRIKTKFAGIYDLKDIRYGEISITLCHYAMRVWNKSHFNAWHLFGHSHGTLAGQGKSMDVGVDSHGFTPISIEQVEKYIELLPDNFNLVR
jgi:calcineurin-like phosphoesterase family protein